ncbi:TspB protein [Paracidovorax valerianellae]|uniref:TspB protein n=1 Tax=Paracidovorax valerianellae TaxID=187868 RepID=A0A1G6IRB0_9BURK|nr:TspB protein [Paracidovorax valerianellae]
MHPGTTTEVAPGTTGETQPATRTNTTTTTHNVTYNNNVVTYNTTTINNTTITNNVTGQTDTTTDETVTEDDAKPEEDKPDLCQKNPDILACQKPDLDTPDGEIPKSTVDVTYQIEDTWGSGACPASLYANINGQSVMVYDWPQTCSIVATYVRPLLLLMCALGALFIVMPGKAD